MDSANSSRRSGQLAAGLSLHRSLENVTQVLQDCVLALVLNCETLNLQHHRYQCTVRDYHFTVIQGIVALPKAMSLSD